VAATVLLPNKYPMMTPAKGVIAIVALAKRPLPAPLGARKYNIEANINVVMIPTNIT
jgi:hypothetical protein